MLQGGRRPDEGSLAGVNRVPVLPIRLDQRAIQRFSQRATPHPRFAHLLPQGEKGLIAAIADLTKGVHVPGQRPKGVTHLVR